MAEENQNAGPPKCRRSAVYSQSMAGIKQKDRQTARKNAEGAEPCIIIDGAGTCLWRVLDSDWLVDRLNTKSYCTETDGRQRREHEKRRVGPVLGGQGLKE